MQKPNKTIKRKKNSPKKLQAKDTEQDNLTRFLHVIPYSFKCDSCYFYRRSVGLLTTSLTKLAHPVSLHHYRKGQESFKS